MLLEDEIVTIEKKTKKEGRIEENASEDKEAASESDVPQLLLAIGSVIAILGIWTFLTSIHL